MIAELVSTFVFVCFILGAAVLIWAAIEAVGMLSDHLGGLRRRRRNYKVGSAL